MIKHCHWCDNNFDTKVSYQIYCSAECRELSTKEKINQRYLQTRRARRHGKDRKCKACNTALSIYNDDTICQTCEIVPKDVDKVLKELKGMANGKNKRNKK
jgi:hypothetical protein